MEETTGWKHRAFRQAEMRRKVCMNRLGDDLGMSQRVLTVLIDPRIQRGDIIVTNLFPTSLVYLAIESCHSYDLRRTDPEDLLAIVSASMWF